MHVDQRGALRTAKLPQLEAAEIVVFATHWTRAIQASDDLTQIRNEILTCVPVPVAAVAAGDHAGVEL